MKNGLIKNGNTILVVATGVVYERSHDGVNIFAGSSDGDVSYRWSYKDGKDVWNKLCKLAGEKAE